MWFLQRKTASNKQPAAPRSRNNQKVHEAPSSLEVDLDDSLFTMNDDDPQDVKPKRLKRIKRSVNENLEPTYTASTSDFTQ